MNDSLLLVLLLVVLLVVILFLTLLLVLLLKQQQRQIRLSERRSIRLETRNQTLLNMLLVKDPYSLRTLQQATESPSLYSKPEPSQEELTKEELSNLVEQAYEVDDEELSRNGFQYGEMPDDLAAAGYEPVIFGVGADGKPSFIGTGTNS